MPSDESSVESGSESGSTEYDALKANHDDLRAEYLDLKANFDCLKAALAEYVQYRDDRRLFEVLRHQGITLPPVEDATTKFAYTPDNPASVKTGPQSSDNKRYSEPANPAPNRSILGRGLPRRRTKRAKTQSPRDRWAREREEFRTMIKTLHGKLDDANQRAAYATNVQKRLHHILDSAVVKRKEEAGVDSFPNGDRIISMTRHSQEQAEDYFFDLVELTLDAKQLSCNPMHYFEILNDVFCNANKVALLYQRTWVAEKQIHFEALLEESKSFDNALAQLFMISNMQRLVRERLKQKKTLMPIEMSDLRNPPPLYELAWSDRIRKHRDMDGRSVATFIQGLVDLYQVSKFSDPPCYVHPAVGETIPYSPDHHKQLICDKLRTKAKAGDIVRVLYPGLYYADPSRDPDAKPVQRAVVLLFDEKECATAIRKLEVAKKKPTAELNESVHHVENIVGVDSEAEQQPVDAGSQRDGKRLGDNTGHETIAKDSNMCRPRYTLLSHGQWVRNHKGQKGNKKSSKSMTKDQARFTNPMFSCGLW